MELIKDTVKTVLASLAGQKPRTNKEDPQTLLKNILTKKEFRHIRINRFSAGVLSFYVDSSAWLYHFNLGKEELLQKLRRDLKELKGVRFYLGDTQCLRKK